MVKALARCFEQVNATSHVPSNSTLGDLHSPNVVVGFQSTASLESMTKPGSPNDGATGTTSLESTHRTWKTHTGLKNFIARTKSALGTHTVDGRARSFLGTRHQNRLASFRMSQLPWEGED